jgi:hypothetical protein
MGNVDKALKKAEALGASKKRQQANRDLTEAVFHALQPQLVALQKATEERLQGVEDAIKALSLVVPDKVEVANEVAIKDTVEVSDPQLKVLSDGIAELRTATEANRLPDQIELADGTVVALDEKVMSQLLARFDQIDKTIEVASEQEQALALLTNNADPKYFLPVRLTDGEQFYKAQTSVVGLGGGTSSSSSSGAAEADYSTNDIDDSTSTEYYGKTDSSAAWLVKKVTSSAVSYATVTNNSGVADYATAWSGRAGLTYGRKDEAF